MRLGIKTDDVFLIELNEKNQQVQNLFLEKIKKITKNHSIDVMLQDGTIKKQQTFDVQKIDNLYKNITEKLKNWSEHGISQTNNEDIRRNFVKLVTYNDDKISEILRDRQGQHSSIYNGKNQFIFWALKKFD